MLRSYTNALFSIFKTAMCKKIYPELINKTQTENVTTGGYYTREHYARQKFYVIQLVTRVDSDLSSYDMIEWPEEQKCMRLTIKCEEQGRRSSGNPGKVIVKAVIKKEPCNSIEEIKTGRKL